MNKKSLFIYNQLIFFPLNIYFLGWIIGSVFFIIILIQLMLKNPTYYRMEGGQRLKVTVQLVEYDKRIQFIVDLLNKLLNELHS